MLWGVAGVGGEGPAEFGSVEHGQVGAFAVGWRELGGVPEQRHALHAVPAVPGGQGEDAAQDRRGVAARDQRGEFGGPAVVLLRDTGGHGRGVQERLDHGNPGVLGNGAGEQRPYP